MRLIGAVQQEFEVELPLGVIFEKGSIAGISHFIENSSLSVMESIPQVEKAEYYKAGIMQKNMYLTVKRVNDLMGPNTIYNMPSANKLEGPIDMDQIRSAVNKVVARHESLRTTYFIKDDEVYQKVLDKVELDVPCIKVKVDDVDEAIFKYQQPYDLENGPLIRVAVLEVSETLHYFIYDIHHTVGDGRTLALFAEEVMRICAGEELKPVQVQIKDYAKWENDREDSDEMEEAEEYWVDCFEESIPPLKLPVDFEVSEGHPHNGERIYGDVPAEVAENIKELAKQLNVTESTVYYTAYLILLNKYTQLDDFTVGIPIDTRNHPSVRDNIGMYVNLIPCRNRISVTDRIKNLIPLVGRDLEEAYEYAMYPSGMIRGKLNEPYVPDYKPLFETFFAFYDFLVPEIELKGIKFSEYQIKKVQAKDEMLFTVTVRPEKVSVGIEYCTNLFKHETMRIYLKDYISILSQICDKEQMVRDIRRLCED